MTCAGIEGDEDFTPFNLPPIPIQDPKEIWKANQKAAWNGRVVQALDSKNNMLQKATFHPLREKDAHFFERLMEVLILETSDALDEECSNWGFAPAQELLSAQITEDMTLEQFLEQTGMRFDRELAPIIDCKCWFKKMAHSAEKRARRTAHSVEKAVRKAAKKVEKKVRETAHSVEKGIRKTAHSVEKNVRETAKDVEKFVRHHPKEVLIVAAAVVVVIITLQIPGVAQAVQTAVAAALAKIFGDALNSSPKREGEWAASLPPVPNPSRPAYHPPVPADTFMQKVFGDLLPPQPTPNHGIYTLDAEQRHARESAPPPPIKAPRPSYTPPSPNGNPVQKFYDNLFQADPHLNPHKHIGKMQPTRPEKPIPTASPEEALVLVPESAPSAQAPFKSDFGSYLENLHRAQIASSNPQNIPSPSAADTTAPVENGFTHFLELVRQGLETIGRMSGPEVDSLDIFNTEQSANPNSSATTPNPLPENAVPSSGSALHFLDVLFNNFQAGGHGIEAQEMGKTIDPGSIQERQNTSSLLKTIAQTLSEHLEQPRSGTSGQEQQPLSNPQLVENSTYKLLEAWVYMNAIKQPFIVPPEVLDRVTYKDPTYSCHFQTEGNTIPGVGIGFIPGMNTLYEEALHHANHIRKFTGDRNIAIDGVYNHTNTAVVDVFEAFTLNFAGIAPNTAKLLVENWTRFFEKNPNGTYLQFAHSQGSIIMAVALGMIPKEMQRKITVVTIGTAEVTPIDLECDSYNYRSRLDWIHLVQDIYVHIQITKSENEEHSIELLMVLDEAKKRLIVLEPHPDAKGIDHDCESPTNDKVFERHILKYLQTNPSLK